LAQVFIDRRASGRRFSIEPQGGSRNKLQPENFPEQLGCFSEP